jgi:hypothetical protein
VPSFEAAGTDAAQAAAFLKTLQSAVSVGNCLKVASLIEFPLKAWANGEPVTIETESELHAKYRQVFTPDVKRPSPTHGETLTASQDGVMFDGGESGSVDRGSGALNRRDQRRRAASLGWETPARPPRRRCRSTVDAGRRSDQFECVSRCAVNRPAFGRQPMPATDTTWWAANSAQPHNPRILWLVIVRFI